MKQGECFKINSIEELKQAYDMFEDWWVKWSHSLEFEIDLFNNYDCRYIKHSISGIYLVNDILKSPLINVNNLNKLI